MAKPVLDMQSKSRLRDPIVSICCITYNHKDYIQDALEGFLMQETNFPFEIIIHDDASTDGTAKIVRAYEKKYPHLVKGIYQKENQYSQGVRPSPTYVWPSARGKYIALCEGDDYWTDPLKLQKQRAFMRKNEDCTLCFHATKFLHETEPEKDFVYKPDNIPDDYRFTVESAIIIGGGLVPTSSMFFKRDSIRELPEWLLNAPVGDTPLLLFLASMGYLGYIDEIMSAYRRDAPGSWSESMKELDNIKKHYRGKFKMWNAFDEWADFQYHNYIAAKKRKDAYKYVKRILKVLLKKMGFYQLLEQ